MVTTIHDGGATRYVTAGAKRTRSADHTRPAAPTCATHPATAAIDRETIASGTTAIPATCATAIRGIARKLSPEAREGDARERQRPDRKEQRLDCERSGEHREGRSSDPGEPRDRRVVRSVGGLNGLLSRRCGGHDDEDRERGAEGQQKRRIRDDQRIGHNQRGGDERQRVERRAALIERSRGEVDDRHERGAIDRRAAPDQHRVRQKHGDRRHHRRPPKPSGEPESGQQQPGEDGDVATRDGNHVVGAGFLQPALDVVVEPRPIANHDRRDDGAGPNAPPANTVGDGAARKGACARHRFYQPACAGQHFDQPAALDRSDQRGPPPRQRALLVGHTGIEIPRRPPEDCRETHSPAGTPFDRCDRWRVSRRRSQRCRRLRGGIGWMGGIGGRGWMGGKGWMRREGSSCACCPSCLLPLPPLLPFLPRPPFLPQDPIDRHAERHAALSSRGIGAKRAFHDRECLIVLGKAPAFGLGLRPLRTRELLERDPQRWPPCALPGIGREQRSPCEESGGDSDGECEAVPSAPCPERQGSRSKSGLQKSGLQEGKEEGGRRRRRRGYLAQESRR